MILFTPTKTMKPSLDEVIGTSIINKNKSDTIRLKLKSYSKDELAKVLKIKNKTLNITYDYYHTDYKEQVAIKLYDGISYKQIKNYDYNFIKNNVLIISALYGPIMGTDLIKPYRLDFLTPKIMEENLYKYWFDEIKIFIESHGVATILNLASNEYSKAIKQLKLNIDIIDLDFNIKQSSTNMKKYRGQILNYCIAKNINDYHKLIGVEFNDFKITGLINNKLKVEV